MKNSNIKTLRELKRLTSQISKFEQAGFDTVDLTMACQRLLNEWISKAEKRLIAKAEFDGPPAYLVMIDNKWVPVKDGFENQQFGLTYTIESGYKCARIGQWAEIDDLGQPEIKLTLSNIIDADLEYFRG